MAVIVVVVVVFVVVAFALLSQEEYAYLMLLLVGVFSRLFILYVVSGPRQEAQDIIMLMRSDPHRRRV